MTENSMWAGFESNEHLKRFLIAASVILLVLTISIAVIFNFLGLSVRTPTLQINVAGSNETEQQLEKIAVANTGISLEFADGHKIANMLVPANQLWIDTKIDVPAGWQVRVSASGSTTLSLSRSVDMARDPQKYDPNLINNLTRPDGRPLNGLQVAERPSDQIRRALRIKPEARLGTLLATVQPIGFQPNDNPRPAPIYHIDDVSNGLAFTNEKSGRLFLTVNDLILTGKPEEQAVWLLEVDRSGQILSPTERTDVYKGSYGANSDVRKNMDEQRLRWDGIQRNRYFNAFVEDNSGEYMVAISIEPSLR